MTRETVIVDMDEVNPPRRWSQRKDSSRALRAEATRLALIAAARQLFTEHGYHDVGIRDVTALAGVTRGALAHHFAGKEALFLAVFDEVEREANQRRRPRPSAACGSVVAIPRRGASLSRRRDQAGRSARHPDRRAGSARLEALAGARGRLQLGRPHHGARDRPWRRDGFESSQSSPWPTLSWEA